MAVTVRQKLAQSVSDALDRLYESGELDGERFTDIQIGDTKQESHGDFACNTALMLAKKAKKNPRELAAALQRALGDAGGLLEKTEIAGPGFLNLFVSKRTWHDTLADIITAGADYVRSDAGAGQRILLEYVSANPTGPLHIAHGRGAVTGDILARLLRAAGFHVHTEYYVNDLGNQVDVFGASIHLRYGELFGRSFEPPVDFYPGDYVTEIAKEIKEEHGDAYLDVPRDTWQPVFTELGVQKMMARIKRDLKDFGITFDSFVSEREMTARTGMQETLAKLEESGAIYEREGKKWFRSTDFGDDKDRVVVREDGRSTYFASDISYHHDKLLRGYEKLINIWGADHGGYIARVKAGISALGHKNDPLEVILIQMVSLTRGGEAVRMGKRLGTAVWLRDVMDEAGADATRYFFVMRRSEAQLDFDIELATKKSLDNPVYYAQMGHARLCSIGRRADAAGVPFAELAPGALEALVLPEEIGIIKRLSKAPEVVAHAAREREPHTVVHYIQDLIGQFHSYFTQYAKTERVISDDPEKTRARLLLCRGLQVILHTFLVDLLGVSAPEEMRLEQEEDASVHA